MKMTNIDKIHSIDITRLSGENYFISLLQEACAHGILTDNDVENLQLQCIELLSLKCERYNSGDSSSIRVEVADNIMKSNLYTIGMYLKTLSDADTAAEQLKIELITEMYQKGRNMIDTKFKVAKQIYLMIQNSKIDTPNYTYNATIENDGLGLFFQSYNPDFKAHESPASIDYQLCNSVDTLVGIEFIQKYMSNFLCENQFFAYFDSAIIHHLLCGYDDNYEDLLINIFEQVLTTALGSMVIGKDPISLNITKDDIGILYSKLNTSVNELSKIVDSAYNRLVISLDIKRPSLKRYIELSLSKVTATIANAVKTDTLSLVFPPLKNLDLLPKIMFSSDEKMDNDEYRKIIEELLGCSSSCDKLSLIKEKINTFGDLEDMLFDAEFSNTEIEMIFDMLGEVELAALIKHHPINADIIAVELSEAELKLRSNLQKYVGQLRLDKQKQILEIASYLVEE
ncbi:MAG: DUF6179 domain-containing protein [Oscillospiraceae bacterium]